MSDQYKRILAIDYGKKRMGLALSDPLLTFAYAFKTLPNDPKFFGELASIIEEKEVAKIILGLPLKESGESYGLTEEVKKFKQTLEKKIRFGGDPERRTIFFIRRERYDHRKRDKKEETER